MAKQEIKKSPTSMVLGILSLFLWWIPIVGLVIPIVGIATKKYDETGMGTAGLVTSIIGLVFTTYMHLAWVVAIIAAIGSSNL